MAGGKAINAIVPAGAEAFRLPMDCFTLPNLACFNIWLRFNEGFDEVDSAYYPFRHPVVAEIVFSLVALVFDSG